jgi:hypothetical protein
VEENIRGINGKNCSATACWDLGKLKPNLRQNNECAGGNSKKAPAGNESELLPLQPTCSVERVSSLKHDLSQRKSE